MPSQIPETGQVVRVRMTKWDGRRHWCTEMAYLGSDEHGHWLGNPPGVRVHRPGVEFVAEWSCAKLVPYDDWYVAHFNSGPSRLAVYVDVTTPTRLSCTAEGWTLTGIDLDLDVVVARDHRGTFVDDEDEFVEHAAGFGYPPDVVATARTTADRVLAAVRAPHEPYRSVGGRWLDRAARLDLGSLLH